jgi:hypothetical protein
VVSGSVVDATNGEAIPGCSVYLEGTEIGVSSVSNGYYRLDRVPRGNYTLIFSIIGYKEVRRRIALENEASVLYEHAKLERSPIQMPEVEVSSRRIEFEQEVTASAYRIDKQALKHTPVIVERDLFRTLMTLPGVTFVSDFTSALYVRGGSPDQNLVLLDNMVLYNPFHFGGFLSTFMIDAVESVEFLTGGFPVRYGNRLSAVLDVESADPEALGGYLSTSLLATEGAAWGRIGKFGGIVTARHTYFDKVIPIFFDFEFPYYFYDIHGVLSWRASPKTRLAATFFHTKDKLDFGEQDIPIGVGWGNQLITLRLIQELRDSWIAKAWVGWSRYTAEFTFTDLMDAENIIDDFSARTMFIRTGERSTLDFGAEGSLYKFLYKVNAEPFATYYINGRPETGAFFASWKYKPNPLFLFQAGTRLSVYHAFYPDTLRDSLTNEMTGIDTLEKTWLEPEARVSGKYFITADDAVNCSVGNFYQNLAMVLPEGGRIPTNFWIPLYARYEPQHALHFILGYEHLFTDGSRIRIEPYYKHYLHLLAFNETFDISDADEDLFSSGAGRAYGVDFGIEKSSGRLTGWVSYSLAFSRFISDTLEFYTSFDRRHSLNILGSYDLGKNWRVNAHFVFASGMPYAGTLGRYRMNYWDPVRQEWRHQWVTIQADRNSLRFPAYHRLDIGASKAWEFRWSTLTVRADIINLYNHKNVMLYYYDLSNEPPVQKSVSMIPIFPSVGVEVRF